MRPGFRRAGAALGGLATLFDHTYVNKVASPLVLFEGGSREWLTYQLP